MFWSGTIWTGHGAWLPTSNRIISRCEAIRSLAKSVVTPPTKVSGVLWRKHCLVVRVSTIRFEARESSSPKQRVDKRCFPFRRILVKISRDAGRWPFVVFAEALCAGQFSTKTWSWSWCHCSSRNTKNGEAMDVADSVRTCYSRSLLTRAQRCCASAVRKSFWMLMIQVCVWEPLFKMQATMQQQICLSWEPP